MNLKWHNKQTIRATIAITAVLFASVLALYSLLGKAFTRFDFAALDTLYRQVVARGKGPPLAEQIVYLLINDETYDSFFDSNAVDRSALATMNKALTEYGPAAVIYDIIFSRRSNPEADQAFATSLQELGVAFLPTAFKHTENMQSFHWKDGVAYERLRQEYLRTPQEHGKGQPFYTIEAKTQWDAFARAAVGSGNISSISSDPDGVYRHLPLLLKVDTQYVPSLSLAAFLNYVQVPFEAVRVDWGHAMTIPARKGSFVAQDIVIPIDQRGRVFIPYAQPWARDFPKMALHSFLQRLRETPQDGNLAAFFEGKFVFVGDVSTGISDLGNTPLEDDVPLIVVHTALLNALLTNTFYRQWTFWQVFGGIGLLALLLIFSALPKSLSALYCSGVLLFVLILTLTWQQFHHFQLLPVVTVGGSFLYMFFGLVVSLHLLMARDQAFIRNAFARFVNEKVVDQLLENPELLRLGGEERTLTVLFSDIEGFTSMSQRMPPTTVVSWLNDYLTEMTEIILQEEGIIDKYIGDGVMAEFGAPIAIPDHADRAVRAGLQMQRHLVTLNAQWQKQGLPQIRCRIGINTGAMVIGNLGSRRVFNYTVTGDAVNLAARLESANKQYHTTFMISEATHAMLTPGLFRVRLLDTIKVKGREKSPPIKVYEVYGLTDEPLLERDKTYYNAYNTAFHAYLQRDFNAARGQFLIALQSRPQDYLTLRMLTRIDALLMAEVPDEWDGSVTLELK